MIHLFHHPNDKNISNWKDRLDQLFLKYEIIEENSGTLPRLLDDVERAEGDVAIDAYLDRLEEFVKGWYEDRCDKHNL